MAPVNHHPDDELLLSYAAGGLDEASSLVVATHLTVCPKCRAGVLAAESAGGALLDEIAPVPMQSPQDIFARLTDAVEPKVAAQPFKSGAFPRTLDAYLPEGPLSWRWIGPGLNYSELLRQGDLRVGLLRTAPGAEIPLHTHSGAEMTMVLDGGYDDGEKSFRYGDVQCADENVLHQPVSSHRTGCTALIMTDGALRPTGIIARVFMRLVGM